MPVARPSTAVQVNVPAPGRRGHTRQLQQGRRQIDVQGKLVADRAGSDSFRITHQQRHPDGFFIRQPPFDTQAVFTVKVAVVAGEER